MTDDDRLLEIATRLLGKGSLVIIDQEIVLAFDAAYRILKAWRTRTGAHEAREQDISDELLERIRNRLAWFGGKYEPLLPEIADIQRARAA